MGDEATAGKSLGTDLVKQKATLPLIRLLGQHPRAQRREELLAILTRDDNHRNEALWPWLQQSDAIAYARDQAMDLPGRLPGSWMILPASPYRESMRALTEFSVDRRA